MFTISLYLPLVACWSKPFRFWIWKAASTIHYITYTSHRKFYSYLSFLKTFIIICNFMFAFRTVKVTMIKEDTPPVRNKRQSMLQQRYLCFTHTRINKTYVPICFSHCYNTCCCCCSFHTSFILSSCHLFVSFSLHALKQASIVDSCLHAIYNNIIYIIMI